MKKRWIIGSLIVVGIIAYILLSSFYTPVKGFEVTIENLTGNNVGGIYLTCGGISKDIEVPVLTPHIKTVVEVQPKNYAENSMGLYYKDKQGAVHKQTIVGYFEESYGNGYVRVEIENVEEDGELQISSKYRFAGILASDEWH